MNGSMVKGTVAIVRNGSAIGGGKIGKGMPDAVRIRGEIRVAVKENGRKTIGRIDARGGVMQDGRFDIESQIGEPCPVGRAGSGAGRVCLRDRKADALGRGAEQLDICRRIGSGADAEGDAVHRAVKAEGEEIARFVGMIRIGGALGQAGMQAAGTAGEIFFKSDGQIVEIRQGDGFIIDEIGNGQIAGQIGGGVGLEKNEAKVTVKGITQDGEGKITVLHGNVGNSHLG